MKLLYQIINYDRSEILKDRLQHNRMDYERLYSFASAHGMLPTLHNAILDKHLQNYFPEDFLNATAYILQSNKARNIAILQQMHRISTLLNQHKINFCYIKGAALLACNYYRDPSDRMIGDIDILVDNADIEKANELLLNTDYKVADFVVKMYLIQHRHLPRLLPHKDICAVELHRKVVDQKNKALRPKHILATKQIQNNHPVPSNTYMLSIAILTDQINDFSYYKWRVNFKTIYDVLVLGQHVKVKTLKKNKYIRRFLLINDLNFGTNDIQKTRLEQFKISFLKFRLNHKTIDTLYNYLIVKRSTLHKVPGRFINLLINPNYLKFTILKAISFFKKHTFKG